MQPLSLPPIPWSHERSDFGSVWLWETPHFLVTVNGNERSCYYQIADKLANPQAAPKPFADGQTATFEQAERLIRETVGKAYPPNLGYQRIAGPLATTFNLASGERVDLGVYSGKEVTVTVAKPDGSEEQFHGLARIRNYHFVLLVDDKTIKISPSHILSVTERITRTGATTPPAAAPSVNPLAGLPAPTVPPLTGLEPPSLDKVPMPLNLPSAPPPQPAAGPRRPVKMNFPELRGEEPPPPLIPAPAPAQPLVQPKRVMIGIISGGCTGKPGIVKNTVEHVGSPCPIHENG